MTNTLKVRTRVTSVDIKNGFTSQFVSTPIKITKYVSIIIIIVFSYIILCIPRQYYTNNRFRKNVCVVLFCDFSVGFYFLL